MTHMTRGTATWHVTRDRWSHHEDHDILEGKNVALKCGVSVTGVGPKQRRVFVQIKTARSPPPLGRVQVEAEARDEWEVDKSCKQKRTISDFLLKTLLRHYAKWVLPNPW